MSKGIPKNRANKKWIGKGHKQSKETREKISKNSPKYWVGKKFSEEHRKRLKESHKGNQSAFKDGRSKNKKHIKERAKNWREKNAKKVKEYTKGYRIKNKEKVLYWMKRRRVQKLGAEGSHTIGEWENLKAQYNWICLSCKKQEPKIKLTEDHIIPLKKGGSDNIENIQPLCRSCNSIKHTKIIRYSLR